MGFRAASTTRSAGCFWTVDEAAVLLGPAVLGLAAKPVRDRGLVAGIAGWLLLRRVKARRRGANIALYALYWFLPDFVLRLRGTPPSHVRRYLG